MEIYNYTSRHLRSRIWNHQFSNNKNNNEWHCLDNKHLKKLEIKIISTSLSLTWIYETETWNYISRVYKNDNSQTSYDDNVYTQQTFEEAQK